MFADAEATLLVAEAGTPAVLAAMVDRRVAGWPLEQVVGWAEFCGLRIAVEPGVFVPRVRTECLVRHATELARHRARPDARPLVVIDLCCGSGAVGVAIAAALGGVELHACDVDPVAVRCARRNVLDLGGQVYEGDLAEPLPTRLLGRVDLLVANVPYVPTDEIRLLPAEARVHEPTVALDGGRDGLAIARRVIDEAPRWLAPGAHLLFETSAHQAPYAVDAVAGTGLDSRVVRCEELDATVVIGVRCSTG